jgi:tight adherence protein B
MMNSTWIKAVVLVCTFGAVLLAVEALLSWYSSSRSEGRAINLRLKLIGQGRTRGEALTLLRRATIDLTTQVPAALIPLARKFDQMMTATQLTVPAGRVLLSLVLGPVAVFLAMVFAMLAAGMVIGFGRILLVGTFAVLIGGVLPLMVLQFMANRTRKRMQDQFPVALDVFVRGLRAGHPIAAALDLLTVEMPDPIGTQFGIVVDEVTYGADLRDALQGMAERWNLEDMRMFVVCLSVQAETGGNLAEILENLSKVIRERASMMMKVRALSSEGRLTGIMLTALPVLAFTVLFLANPRFYLDVSDDPWFVPGFATLIILYLVGFFTIRRMVDLKV